MESRTSYESFKGFRWWKLAIVAALFAALYLLYYAGKRVLFLEFVENYQLAYQYDWQTGEVTPIDRPGYHAVTPFVTSIYTIDLRPMQVCVEANNRVLNCKLVAFNKEGYEAFIAMHGATDYEGQTFQEILKSYAYDGRSTSYPFLTILRELGGDGATPAGQ
jgi:hypothetical protein